MNLNLLRPFEGWTHIKIIGHVVEAYLGPAYRRIGALAGLAEGGGVRKRISINLAAKIQIGNGAVLRHIGQLSAVSYTNRRIQLHPVIRPPLIDFTGAVRGHLRCAGSCLGLTKGLAPRLTLDEPDVNSLLALGTVGANSLARTANQRGGGRSLRHRQRCTQSLRLLPPSHTVSTIAAA